jgi:hypothetical protein
MTPKANILSRHKLTTSIATGATVIVLATGGSAIADSGSSTSATGNSAKAATAGKVIPLQRGAPSPASAVD